MKRRWKYVFPLILGLVIYGSIRLVTDTPSGEKFWTRSGPQNAIEISFVVIMSYVFDAFLRYSLSRFNLKQGSLRLSSMMSEFAGLVLVCLLILNPVVWLIHFLASDPIDMADIAIANVIVLLYILLYYAIVRGNRVVRSYIEQQTQMERLKTENLQTELKFLKAQYHPHFLFNALNTIYFQMDEDIPAAKQTVQTFSQLLRYQLYDHQQLVTIAQEWEHVQNFARLQTVRITKKLSLQCSFDPALEQEKIYPLLLLPLVENAFKYVGGSYRIRVTAECKENRLYFSVLNSMPEEMAPAYRGGIGLENLRRRLELLYPGAHQLCTQNKDNHFEAQLILDLA